VLDAAEGVLVIWHDVDESAERDFVNWHVREHIPERVALPGFLRGLRYIAVEGRPKYFNFYEATTAGAFSSERYRERLNDPTPWTRRVVAHFRNFARTVCRRVAKAGTGDGAFVQTLRISTALESSATALLPALVKQDGIVAASLLEGIREASAGASEEKKLRSSPDEIAERVLIVESVEAAYLNDPAHLRTLETFGDAQRGIYRLQYALSRRML
jgi:hypothetical protein